MKEPGRRSYYLLLELATKLPTGFHYLEIGVCEGVSAGPIITGTSVGLAVLIDFWTQAYGGTGRGSSKHIIELLGPHMAKTIILTGDSKAILPMMDHQFDMIFVDGDHSAEGCLTDATNSLRLLKPHGFLVLDDMDHPAHTYLRGVAAKFADDHGFNIEWHPDEWFGMAVLKRN